MPNISIRTKRGAIRAIATNPTLVDCFACSLAFKIAVNESGIREIIKICRLGIPSINFGKNCEIKLSDKTITIITNSAENNKTRYIIFLWVLQLDSSDNKKECKESGNRERKNKI